jgi:hypothetical protein
MTLRTCNTLFLHNKIYRQPISALDCIFKIFASGKDFLLNLIWPKVAFMAWHIVFSINP